MSINIEESLKCYGKSRLNILNIFLSHIFHLLISRGLCKMPRVPINCTFNRDLKSLKKPACVKCCIAGFELFVHKTDIRQTKVILWTVSLKSENFRILARFKK